MSSFSGDSFSTGSFSDQSFDILVILRKYCLSGAGLNVFNLSGLGFPTLVNLTGQAQNTFNFSGIGNSSYSISGKAVKQFNLTGYAENDCD